MCIIYLNKLRLHFNSHRRNGIWQRQGVPEVDDTPRSDDFKDLTFGEI